ncbi:GTA head formation protein, RCAP_rcc01685 family [Aestuariivita boseongensis]|uniref:GTA head formation protein, RCAP_rcc01685 family n=1 Tax=Aestuariivita boseongensis TaxID=1470562 RepID=UPI00067FA768|nr:hypothetical protein [Aestuariivita boseongensis]
MGERENDFICAPGLRLKAHERVTEVQFKMMTGQIDRVEEMVETIERRLWLIVYGMLAVILAETFRSVFTYVQ